MAYIPIKRTERFLAQPQYAAPVAPEFQAYNPKIAILPASGVNLATGKAVTLVNDVKRRNGNFYFPGADGYIDLGSTAYPTAGELSLIVVSKLDSFINQFPCIFGMQTSEGSQFEMFYSNFSSAYSDISIGTVSPGGSYNASLAQFGSVTGTWHKFVYTQSGMASPNLWCNGIKLTLPGAGSGVGSFTGNATLGQQGSTSTSIDFAGEIAGFALCQKKFPDALAQRLSENPWQFFQASPKRIWVAGGAASFSLGADSGVFAVTGTSASLKFGRLVTASGGSVAITGTAATLKHGRSVAADSGTVAVTGTAASLLFKRLLSASAGSFAITGTDATLTKGTGGAFTLAADSGSFDVTGNTASLVYTRLFSASSGSVIVTGTAASLIAARTLTASAGAIAVTGTDATLTLAANSHYTLTASSGSVDVVGVNATLTRSGGDSFSGGHLYVSREEHAERKKKQRIKFGIIEEEKPEVVHALEQFEISNLTQEKPKKHHIGARQQKKLAEQEAENAELKRLIQLELDREEETIIRMLMEM